MISDLQPDRRQYSKFFLQWSINFFMRIVVMNIKKLFLLNCVLVFSFVVSVKFIVCGENPLLVVVIMVKDEEAVIKQTLRMYCDADPHGEQIGYLVYDTGLSSWSPTMAKAKELFDEYGITNFFILQEPFEDFATSRNRALKYAHERFPHAGFMLMPDAEWYLHNVPTLLEFCKKQLSEAYYHTYLIQILSPGLDFYSVRLLRVGKGAYFKGVVHEYLYSETGSLLGPKDVYFEYPERPAGLDKSKARWVRDRELLLREYMRDPLEPRNTFYLAQTYDCLEELSNAYFYYSQRTKLKGFVEEDYMAHYRLGCIVARLRDAQGNIDWPCALRHYLDAFMLRPCRIEPLVRIAAFYLNNNLYELAFLYAYIACQVPYPQDVLFVEKDLYEKTRYEILAKSMSHAGLEIPEKVYKNALAYHAQTVPLEGFFLKQSLGIAL
jgi:hypothetical protein